ncbi:C40 family peptidase [Leptothermofonsia sp. ETS-13]|uniref:C40 family peptidase n=1 Tax=Leptothermofonsia sp. ETS-13 TaxID=3035696 RepID=UPI003BA2569D
MVSFAQLQTTFAPGTGSGPQYRCSADINLYSSSALDSLATQAAAGRYLKVVSLTDADEAIKVCLCEDDYPGWLDVRDLEQLEVAGSPYQPALLSEAEIRARVPDAIAFAKSAMAQPNEYLWGGTVGPNFDCSGLVQTAFASVGIWLPRDAYQQEAFVQVIALEDLSPGDLVFFGTPVKATHVGIYLGDDCYIHSSGKDQGRNGIGIDCLSGGDNLTSQKYAAQIRGAGRVMAAYISSCFNDL